MKNLSQNHLKNLPGLAVYKIGPQEKFLWDKVKADYARDRQILKYDPDDTDSPDEPPNPFRRGLEEEVVTEENFDEFESVDNFDNFAATLQERLESLQADHKTLLAEEQKQTKNLGGDLKVTDTVTQGLKDFKEKANETSKKSKKSRENTSKLETEIQSERNLNDEYRAL